MVKDVKIILKDKFKNNTKQEFNNHLYIKLNDKLEKKKNNYYSQTIKYMLLIITILIVFIILNDIIFINNNNLKIKNNLRSNESIYVNLLNKQINYEIDLWEKKNNKKYTLNEAVLTGDLEHIKWLKKNKCNKNKLSLLYNEYCFNNKTFDNAVINGNLNNIKWLKENDCPFGKKTFDYAIENENLENIKWLTNNNCNFSTNTFNLAIKKDNYIILRCLIKYFPIFINNICNTKNNTVNIKALKRKYCKIY